MKIAICGGGVLAIEMGLMVNDWGGSFVIFSPSEQLGGGLKRLAENFPSLSLSHSWFEASTICGRTSLNLSFTPEEGEMIPTIQEYWQRYLRPLSLLPVIQENWKKSEVLRVHKRFLGLQEEIPGKHRLTDLFRVVTPVNQVQDTESLSPVFQDSLQLPLEACADFDMVISATGVCHFPLPMGPGSSLALGEGRGDAQERIHSFTPWSQWEKIRQDWSKKLGKKLSRLAVVGSGSCAAMALWQMQGWMREGGRIVLITDEETPFQKLKDTTEFNSRSAESFLYQKLQGLLKDFEKEQLRREKVYQEELEKWQNLDDFVKVKVKRPEIPISPLTFSTMANVTSVEKLLDLDDLFLTIEWPHFRGREKNQHNLESDQDLSTLAVDGIIVATGYKLGTLPYQALRARYADGKKTTLSSDGSHPEIGFYTLGAVTREHHDRYNLAEGLQQLVTLEKIILSYFTKVGST